MKLIEIHHITPETRNDIEDWIRTFGISKPNYNIHPETGVVDVYQSVVIKNQGFTSLPIKFGVLAGCFTIKFCTNLTSLDGCPQIVDNTFNCSNNPQLTSAVGGPQIVREGVHIKSCPIKSFEGFPKEIINSLYINDLKINTFSGINKWIKSITDSILIGADCYMYHNGMMGLMLIRNLKRVISTPFTNHIVQHEAIQIINKHLAGDRFVTECQLELQDAGFQEYAKL
jgi:hypothetical protein